MASSKSSSKSRVAPPGTSSKSRLAAKSSKSRAAAKSRPHVVFGLVAASTDDDLGPRVDRLLEWVGKKAGVALERHEAASYEALAKDVKKDRVDVAWLPPIVYVRLAGDVTPCGTILRGGKDAYETALIVRKDSKAKTVANVRGSRAGWVDRWSAAGFVLPRVNLALLGIDPRTFFRTETFHGSHRAVVRALVEGACDVAGTYARTDGKGKTVDGAWSEVEGADVRVLATFGAIPPDVVAARKGLPEPLRLKVWDAIRAAADDSTAKKLVRDVFGGDAMRDGLAKSHESLSKALDLATARGLFD